MIGIEVVMRNGFGIFCIFFGFIVCEFYKFDVDFCNIEDLLGKNGM